MRVLACRIFPLILLAIFAFSGTVFAQGSHIVYGEGFSFKITDPNNWNGYVEDANRHDVNYYFCMPNYDFVTTPVLMYIRVLKKNGNSVEKNLELDMEHFRRTHDVQFSEYQLQNLEYKYASKQYLLDDKVIDYLCYIDPKENVPVYVIFVLSGPKELCGEYLNDFQTVIQSFTWITDRVKAPISQ